MKCPKCQHEIQKDFSVCPGCQTELVFVAKSQSAPTDQKSADPYQSPKAHQTHPQANTVQTGDATGGVIPYKNPKALMAYYLGILSGLPLIGFPIGIAAFVLGVLGIRDRKRNPLIKGSVHAGIGIGCGAIFTIFWGFVLVMMLFALLAGEF